MKCLALAMLLSACSYMELPRGPASNDPAQCSDNWTEPIIDTTAVVATEVPAAVEIASLLDNNNTRGSSLTGPESLFVVLAFAALEIIPTVYATSAIHGYRSVAHCARIRRERTANAMP